MGSCPVVVEARAPPPPPLLPLPPAAATFCCGTASCRYTRAFFANAPCAAALPPRAACIRRVCSGAYLNGNMAPSAHATPVAWAAERGEALAHVALDVPCHDGVADGYNFHELLRQATREVSEVGRWGGAEVGRWDGRLGGGGGGSVGHSLDGDADAPSCCHRARRVLTRIRGAVANLASAAWLCYEERFPDAEKEAEFQESWRVESRPAVGSHDGFTSHHGIIIASSHHIMVSHSPHLALFPSLQINPRLLSRTASVPVTWAAACVRPADAVLRNMAAFIVIATLSTAGQGGHSQLALQRRCISSSSSNPPRVRASVHTQGRAGWG